MSISLTWHGHSCFTIACGGYSIVVDPYAPGSVPGLPALSLAADQVLCSHSHSDHNAVDRVALRTDGPENPFHITSIDTFHDDAGGSLRGTDRIHIFEAQGLKVAHLGDLGCDLTPDQAKQLMDLDAILIPVGGYYTIDASQAKALTAALKPRVVVPMHYRSEAFGYPVIGTLDEYTKLCDDVVVLDSDTIEITKDTKPQTAILSFNAKPSAE